MYYTPKLPCDATQIVRIRAAISESGVEKLLKATIDAAVQEKVVKSSGISLKQSYTKEGKELRREAGG